MLSKHKTHSDISAVQTISFFPLAIAHIRAKYPHIERYDIFCLIALYSMQKERNRLINTNLLAARMGESPITTWKRLKRLYDLELVESENRRSSDHWNVTVLGEYVDDSPLSSWKRIVDRSDEKYIRKRLY
jgi:hypothetical protein